MAAPPVPPSTSKHHLSPSEISGLAASCIRAKATAYCPYSNFKVGATILTADGRHVSGANVENASYSVGTCAERTAFARAVTDGYRKFKALAVASDISPPASPCGMCRQFIREFCSLDLPILMFDKDGNHITMTLEELLPMSFGPEALQKPASPNVASSVAGDIAESVDKKEK